MAITLTGSVPSAASFTAAYKAASQSISGGGSTPLKAPSGTTVKNAAGQLINDAGEVVGGAVTSSGQLSYDGKTAIPGSSTYRDTGITTIKPSDLTTVPLIKLPTPTIGTAAPLNSLISNGNASLGMTDPKTGQFIQNTESDIDASESRMEKLLKDSIDALGEPKSKEDIYRKTEQEVSFNEKQNRVNAITGQLNTLITNSQAAQLAEVGQGRGIPETIIGGRQAQIAREAAINALPLQAQLAIAQGDLSIAAQRLDTLFKLRSEDADNEYNYRKDVINTVYSFASEQEKRKLNRIEKALDQTNQRINKNLEVANDWAKTAVSTGQSDLVTAFTSLDPASPTFRQDMGKIQAKVVDYDKILDRKLTLAKIAEAEAKAARMTAGSGGNSSDLLAYASNMAASGKLPTPSEVESSGLTVGQVANMARELPQPKGFVVDLNTGVKSATVPATAQEDFTRLYNITQNTKRLKELDKKRVGGLVSGTLGKIFGSDDQAAYIAVRKAIVDDMSRMQSGAALTEDETEFYEGYLPGRLSESFFLGQDSLDKITNFEKIMNDRLSERLNSNGLGIYGYSTVKVDGKTFTLGDEIELENGKRGRILPGGYVSTIEE